MSLRDDTEFINGSFIAALESLGGEGTTDQWDTMVQVMNRDIFEETQFDDAFPEMSVNARSRLRDIGVVEQVAKGLWRFTQRHRQAKLEEESQTVSEDVRLEILPAAPDAVSLPREPRSEHDGSDNVPDLDQVLDARLQALSPAAFERLCQALLKACGFVKVAITGQSGDGGIDGYGLLQISLISFPVMFQCKRYAKPVGAGAVRDFRGAMQGRSDKGILFTTSRFTQDARDEATRPGVSPIELVDGAAFRQLLVHHRVGIAVRVQRVESAELDWAFFDGMEEAE